LASTTSSACVPIEPVEPKMAIVFLLLKNECLKWCRLRVAKNRANLCLFVRSANLFLETL